ncbi:MAG: ACP S-malonyltransferase [Deltaproteobacteria bacterium]|nr:ACP S-malonyltransferase [Deltaproteobacteria bacterium]MBW1737869.1 ACP S-malonyltransferase [Deltaproteobacteria bacterium]MBW1909057.1 ACP S-malonyltransferase [Deltaproteobacteria bacterium]MBW2034865.1 ACP S-malonyltransferase [Deltaproteobacteria bacterium]MBW2115306.1 ACP S-malonyltransferase [Deltaproteobacteria bacterium]
MKTRRITLIFPGQGSQYVGMGKELFDRFKLVREIYDEATQVLGYDISELCFKKHTFGKFMHKADLNRTIYTQPAVLTMSYACYRVLEETCKECNVDLNTSLLAGHSLGEYTALLISGAMDFKTTLSLVQKRATFMTEWGKAYPDAGLMAIVDKGRELDYDRICALCKDFGVYVTLNNTRSQVVVGGSKRRLAEMGKELKREGKRSTMLKVEGPFHTPIMKPAADKFKKELDKSEIHIASKPVMANVTSEAIVDPAHIRKELHEQIFKIVNWRGGIERIAHNRETLFIEVGPKKVLSNMINDIDPSIPRLNIEDVESLEKTVKELTILTAS